MLERSIQIFFASFLVLTGVLVGAAQTGADNRSPFYRRDDSEEMPKAVKETRERMRIERETKEHNEMLERGEQVRKLSEQLEKSFAENGRLSDKDLAALESVEKTVKKIRNELGGDDDDDDSLDEVLGDRKDISVADAVNTFSSTTANLVDELKKTTRFCISATAIQTSNAVIKLARFLRVRK